MTGNEIVTAINDSATTLDIAAGRLSPDALIDGASYIPDSYFRSGMRFWALWQGAASVIQISDAIAGNRVLQNDPNQVAWIYSRAVVPCRSNATYEVTGSFRRPGTTGSAGTIYLAVILMDANGANITGDGAWWYYPVVGVALTDTVWHSYSAQFGAGTARTFPANARFMTVGATLNYDGSVPGNRTYQVAGLEIARVP